jgi:protocatechuate 3,4-dioxygenase beta subunit
MSRRALFEGLVFDENGNPAQVTYVGEEPCYVVDDAGFLRHIPSEQVDRQVLENLEQLIAGSEDAITAQAAQMLGQDDIFTRAMIENQLKNIGQQFDALMEAGIPEETRAYMGMMGFRIRINIHGEVLDVEQPGMIAPEDE